MHDASHSERTGPSGRYAGRAPAAADALRPGLSHSSADQVVTDNEKQALLAYLKGSHGEKVEEPRKITLQRKTTTTLESRWQQDGQR